MTTDSNSVSYFSRLDADECWALLAEAEVGRIAWQGPEGIVIVPVNFQAVDGAIVFHTAPESGLARLAEETPVSFQVDDIDRDSAIGWSVLVRGTSGPADASLLSKSWLAGDQPVGVAVTASGIEGRVVSGTKKN